MSPFPTAITTDGPTPNPSKETMPNGERMMCLSPRDEYKENVAVSVEMLIAPTLQGCASKLLSLSKHNRPPLPTVSFDAAVTVASPSTALPVALSATAAPACTAAAASLVSIEGVVPSALCYFLCFLPPRALPSQRPSLYLVRYRNHT